TYQANKPEGQNIAVKKDTVPDPADGIKNKDDLPDGTKYTWEKTPDVSKPGDVPAIVVVTYPDGSKDKVDVHIVVDNPTPEPQD
ncbi:Rib/alpha-like domain-containing protein, partial [Staphylococcus epidermidis]